MGGKQLRNRILEVVTSNCQVDQMGCPGVKSIIKSHYQLGFRNMCRKERGVVVRRPTRLTDISVRSCPICIRLPL